MRGEGLPRRDSKEGTQERPDLKMKVTDIVSKKKGKGEGDACPVRGGDSVEERH